MTPVTTPITPGRRWVVGNGLHFPHEVTTPKQERSEKLNQFWDVSGPFWMRQNTCWAGGRGGESLPETWGGQQEFSTDLLWFCCLHESKAVSTTWQFYGEFTLASVATYASSQKITSLLRTQTCRRALAYIKVRVSEERCPFVKVNLTHGRTCPGQTWVQIVFEVLSDASLSSPGSMEPSANPPIRQSRQAQANLT